MKKAEVVSYFYRLLYKYKILLKHTQNKEQIESINKKIYLTEQILEALNEENVNLEENEGMINFSGENFKFNIEHAEINRLPFGVFEIKIKGYGKGELKMKNNEIIKLTERQITALKGRYAEGFRYIVKPKDNDWYWFFDNVTETGNGYYDINCTLKPAISDSILYNFANYKNSPIDIRKILTDNNVDIDEI